MASIDQARALEQALGQLLLRRNRSSLYDAVLAGAPDGIDRQTYPVLSGLDRLGPQTAARLAEEIGIDRSGTSRYADRLQAAGLLRRDPDPDDRRATLLTLTAQGQALARELHQGLAEHLAARIADWQDPAVATLVEGIQRLITPPQQG